MDEETLKNIAAQLRQPTGEGGIQVGARMNEGNHHIHAHTIESFDLKAGDHVLEIGMANGFFVKDIFAGQNSIRYTGCDFSELMIEEAQKNNQHLIADGNIEFIYADANQELPFRDETFDKIFTINTIYFWENPAATLSEISRILKPAGQLTIAIRPRSVMENYPFTKYGFTLYSKPELTSLLSENNFKVIQVLEKAEPEIEIGDKKSAAATLLVQAEKIGNISR